MNVYDFDKTIFPKDSTTAFYFFCLRRYPQIARHWPYQMWAALCYATGRNTKTQMKQKLYRFMDDLPKTEALAEEFWAHNAAKIHPWYLAQKTADDVVISASPDFLLRPICSQLGIGTLIASLVDPKTGKYSGLNCYGEEKVLRFMNMYPPDSVDEFYSDSLSDTPMAMLAKKAFLVKHGQLLPWPERALSSEG